MRTETIVLPLISGRCRWCQNTTRGGATWADRHQTLCLPCAELDTVVRTPAGRKLMARMIQPLFEAAARQRTQRARRPRATR